MIAIDTNDYKKLTNYFKKLYRPKDGAVLKYVNIYNIDDLVQDYLLFKVEGKNKTPKQFYDYKMRDAYNRKKAAPQVYMSHMTNRDCSSYNEEIYDFHDENITNYLKLSKTSGTTNEMARDLCIVLLTEFVKGLSYYVFLAGYLDYEIQFATKEEIDKMMGKESVIDEQDDSVLVVEVSA